MALISILLIFISTVIFTWTGVRLLQEATEKYEEKYVAQTQAALEGMFVYMDAKRLFRFNMIIMVVSSALGYLITEKVTFLIIFGLVGFFLPQFIVKGKQKKRLKQFEAQFVDAITVLSNALKAGQNFVQALSTLEKEQEPPISQEFGLVIREYRLGVPVEDALENLTKRIASDDLKLLVTAVNIVLAMGGNLREIFDTMAHVIRERNRIEGKTKSLTAQGKMQAVVAAVLPSAFGVVLYVMDPPLMTRMFTDTIGIIALGGTFALQFIGYTMIKKVSSIDI